MLASHPRLTTPKAVDVPYPHIHSFTIKTYQNLPCAKHHSKFTGHAINRTALVIVIFFLNIISKLHFNLQREGGERKQGKVKQAE